jgi:PknH-like extracellular domain
MRELTAALTVAATCILTAACGGGGNEGTTSTTQSTLASPTASTTAPPTTSTPAPPVAESALDALLLSPAEIDTAVGATGMAVAATSTLLAQDITLPPDAPPEKVACVGIAAAAEAQAYAGSGSTAVRDQLLKTPSGNGAPLSADQAVVLFATAGEAATFLAESAKRWPTCREYNLGGSPVEVGEVSNTDGMLATSVTIRNENQPNSRCERALTVKNNVAIDVSTCDGSSGSAVKIADQIAAKVPGQ